MPRCRCDHVMAAARLKTALWTLTGAALLAAAGATAFVWSGLYDISATSQHTAPVYALLQTTMQQSVRLSARHVQVPGNLGDPARVERGAVCFRDKCAQCHGAPGIAQDEIGLSMQPLPGPLINAAQQWKARELYWITRNGVKMSGMPAWEFRLPEEDLWALVAFLERLPALSTRDYHALMAAQQGQQCQP